MQKLIREVLQGLHSVVMMPSWEEAKQSPLSILHSVVYTSFLLSPVLSSCAEMKHYYPLPG